MKAKLTTAEFIRMAKKVHGDKYSYTKSNYVSKYIKVIITCKEHGDFLQLPGCHKNGHGCKKCAVIKSMNAIKVTQQDFIILATKKHGDLYDYSKVKLLTMKKKVTIICKIHGEFEQNPEHHLANGGCKKCGSSKGADKNRKNINDFITESNKVHKNSYTYLKVDYKNIDTNIIITCKTHGDFSQIPYHHLNGSGCPLCKNYKPEQLIFNYLKNKKLNITIQKKFQNCKNIKQLPFDFYINDYNCCIEYDGEYHYKNHFSDSKNIRLEKQQNNDKIKTKFCKENNIPLLRIPYWEKDNKEKLITEFMWREFNVVI